jgi:hypothetical protein
MAEVFNAFDRQTETRFLAAIDQGAHPLVGALERAAQGVVVDLAHQGLDRARIELQARSRP